LLQYYTEVLGAKVYDGLPGSLGTPDSALVGFTDTGVKLELVSLPDGQNVDFKLASGRFATETEDGAPEKVGQKVNSLEKRATVASVIVTCDRINLGIHDAWSE